MRIHRWLWLLLFIAVPAVGGLIWLNLFYLGEQSALLGEPDSTQKPAGNRWQAVHELGLPALGDKFAVHYSVGQEKRAREVAGLIEKSLQFYQSKHKIKAEFSVAVLTRADWQLVEPRAPYGLPSVSPPPHVVLLPAMADGVVVKDVMSLRERASPATLEKLAAAGFTFEEGAQQLTDLIGLHELGHVLTLAYGIGLPSRWSNEFLATYFAYAYLSAEQPRLAAVFDAMTYGLYVADGARPKYTSLEDFDLLYSQVGPANYAWYQSVLQGRVRQVHEVRKLAFFDDVRAVYPLETRDGEPARVVLQRLERICPGFVEWGEKLR